MTTPMGSLPSTMLIPGSVQIKRGTTSGSRNLTTANYNTALLDTAGNPMAITVTPSLDCFWHTRSNVMHQGAAGASGGAWQRIDYVHQISPADADGLVNGIQVCNQVFDSGTVGWKSVNAQCMFRLTGGVAYTCTLVHVFQSGATVQYHTGLNYIRLIGRLVGEGSAI